MNQVLADKITIELLQKIAKDKGYKIFQNDSKDYNLNIWNIRSSNNKSNSFDDIGVIFWKHNAVWTIEKYSITTDPGVFYLQTLLNPIGCGILKPGQYLNTWQLGLHKGKYKALVQVKPVTTIRDYDLDTELDTGANLKEMLADSTYIKKYTKESNMGDVLRIYDNKNKLVYVETTGLYGINYHHSGKTFVGKLVSNWSAACQVFFDYNQYWNNFIPLLEDAEKIWSNSFSITLIEEKDLYV